MLSLLLTWVWLTENKHVVYITVNTPVTVHLISDLLKCTDLNKLLLLWDQSNQNTLLVIRLLSTQKQWWSCRLSSSVLHRKVWLSKEGSPSSRITRACFSNQRSIDKLELSGFKTRFWPANQTNTDRERAACSSDLWDYLEFRFYICAAVNSVNDDCWMTDWSWEFESRQAAGVVIFDSW